MCVGGENHLCGGPDPYFALPDPYLLFPDPYFHHTNLIHHTAVSDDTATHANADGDDIKHRLTMTTIRC